MLELVNEKVIDGRRYTAKRDSENPRIQVIECDGVSVTVRIKDVWNDPAKLKGLF